MGAQSATDEEKIAMPIIIDVVLCISTSPYLRLSTQTQIACYAYSALPYRWLAYFSMFLYCYCSRSVFLENSWDYIRNFRSFLQFRQRFSREDVAT
jgi:hypothetical protein